MSASNGLTEAERAVRAWAERVDDRDISDEAHRWADDESGLTALPENMGEWKASLAFSFDAGRQLNIAERDEARAWVRRLTAAERVLTCAYCGKAYAPGTPDHGVEVLTAHTRVCEKHPLRVAEAALDAERERCARILESAEPNTKAQVVLNEMADMLEMQPGLEQAEALRDAFGRLCEVMADEARDYAAEIRKREP